MREDFILSKYIPIRELVKLNGPSDCIEPSRKIVLQFNARRSRNPSHHEVAMLAEV